VAVFGNHDWDDGERVRRALTSQGVVVCVAHEPDIFPRWMCAPRSPWPHPTVGAGAATHRGRVIVPSRYGQRYAAGHFVEADRHLFVTTGVSTSMLPVRFGVPSEVLILELR
jgi:hypothetical protein